jgi:hypothetical protein
MASTFRKTDPAIFEAASCSSLSLSRLSQTTALVISWHRPDGRVRNARILATGSPRIIGLSALNDGSVALTGAFSATTTFDLPGGIRQKERKSRAMVKQGAKPIRARL